MLSTTSTEIVKTTLPAVEQAIGDITRVFYRNLFAAHPELERDLFNRGNQAQGDQQRALAGAIAAYASLLVGENGGVPVEVVTRIAHKHASLGITQDQYRIVHNHLFAAIVQVLGDAVTPEVAAAWDEVYWHMANTLIMLEKQLYADAGVAAGDVWRTVIVRRRVQESPDTVSFVLAAPDGSALPQARPGQYISVAVTLPDGARQIRQYSLTRTSVPSEWAVSVKALAARRTDENAILPAGEVSNFLHHNVFENDELEVSAPFGDLVIEDTREPLVLISAGIGVTPIIGILHHLAHSASERDVIVVHADRSPARHAHRQELKELVAALPAARLYRWYEDLGVRPTRDTLHAGWVDLSQVAIPAAAQVYLCGPMPFMEAARRALIEQDVPASNIHYEVFGPDMWLTSA